MTESEQTAAFTRNFNPLLEAGNVRWPARSAMYEPLLIFNPMSDGYVPWLAERYEYSEDGLRILFSIRSGVRWSDGASFDADDVVFTFELLKRYKALDLTGVWEYLAGVTSPEEGLVEFTLKHRFRPGLLEIAHQPIVAEHIWRKVSDPLSFTNENPVGTGPFTEVSTFKTQVYQIDRNPYYWQKDKPKVRALRIPAFPGNEQSNLALVRGEIDWAGDFVPAIDRIFVGRDPEHHHYWFPMIDGMVLLYANTAVAPYDDIRVRKALSMAIDRKLLVKVAMHNTTRPADATGLADNHRQFKNPEAVARGDWVNHSPSEAIRVLDEVGLKKGSDGWRRRPDGSEWKVFVNVPTGFSDWVRAAQVITHDLKLIGVQATIKAYDINAWYEKLQEGDYELSLGWSEVGPTPYRFYKSQLSAKTVRPVGVSTPVNWHRFGSVAADKALSALEKTLDVEEERRLLNELQDIFVDQVPAIPLFPGPLWGEYNSTRFVGFPNEKNPYAPLSPHWAPQTLLVLTELAPR